MAEMFEWSINPCALCLQNCLRTIFTSGTLLAKASSSDLLIRMDIVIMRYAEILPNIFPYAESRRRESSAIYWNWIFLSSEIIPFHRSSSLRLVSWIFLPLINKGVRASRGIIDKQGSDLNKMAATVWCPFWFLHWLPMMPRQARTPLLELWFPDDQESQLWYEPSPSLG